MTTDYGTDSDAGSAHSAEPVTKVAAVLSERNQTHGDASEQFSLAQALKGVVRAYDNRDMTALEREALDMIMVKISRVIAGDSHFADHWTDIAGYATLVVDRLPGGRSYKEAK